MLTGRRALITGGDSGIGRAVAIAYAREGADVALVYLPEEQPDAEETARWVQEAGRTLRAPADGPARRGRGPRRGGPGRDRAGWARHPGEQRRATRWRAGGRSPTSRREDLDRTFTTNLYALFWVTQTALEHLGDGAAIINNSSIQAYQPSETLLDYASTKAAINNFTVNLAAEVGSRGIRVNAVAPGPIWTPLQPATQFPEKIEKFGSDAPLGRAGQPAEVAPAFVFLAADSTASYVSGTVLGVTGGKPVF